MNGKSKLLAGGVILLVVLFLGWHGREVLDGTWRLARGYEFERIAHSVSDGEGYSFGDPTSWLGPYDDGFNPTAWVEPVQVGLMAVAFRTLGERGRLPLVLLNYFWFACTCLVVVEVGRRLGNPLAGAFAAVALAAFGPGKNELLFYVGNSALAGLLVCMAALALALFLERPSKWGSIVFGMLLGLLALTHAGTALFIPFAAVGIGLNTKGGNLGHRWSQPALLLLAAGAVVSPWTARNWTAFGELVPVRTGLGQNMHYALPALAQTIQPDIHLGPEWSPPPWTARNARDAVRQVLDRDRWGALVNHSLEVGRAAAVEDYDQLNEAQRDAILAKQSFAFIWDHPTMAVRLAAAKLYGFSWGNWPDFRLLTLLAFVGAGYAIKNRLAWPIPCLVLLYLIPYLLSAPIYYRYRAPVEPLLFLLAGLPVGQSASWILGRLKPTQSPSTSGSDGMGERH